MGPCDNLPSMGDMVCFWFGDGPGVRVSERELKCCKYDTAPDGRGEQGNCNQGVCL